MNGLQRLASALVAVAYVLAMWRHDGWRSAVALLVPLSVPLVLIWYAEAIGSYTGAAGRIRVTQPSPSALIRGWGWLLLIGPAAVIAVVMTNR